MNKDSKIWELPDSEFLNFLCNERNLKLPFYKIWLFKMYIKWEERSKRKKCNIITIRIYKIINFASMKLF